MPRRRTPPRTPGLTEHRLAPLLLALGLAACGGEGAAGGSGTTTSGAGEARTCTAPGLEQATPLSPLSLTDCSFPQGGPAAAPRVLRGVDEVIAALHCTGQVSAAEAAATLDLDTHDVYVVTYTMSPAFGGIAVYERDATLTLLTRFRPNCPGDPMPMPMEGTLAWLVPKGPTRALTQANCSLPRECD